MLLIAAILAAVSGEAAAPREHSFSNLALSPSGDQVVAVEFDEGRDTGTTPHHRLVLRATASGAIQRTLDPCAGCDYVDPVYSPDGRSLAFIGVDSAAARANLYVATPAGVRLRATIQGVAQSPRWSPNGKTVALLTVIGAHKAVGATQTAARQVGEIGENYDEQRIAVADADGSAPLRLVSPTDRFIYEFDWTPDGRGFVASSATGDGDNNWWVADLQAIDVATGATRQIAKPKDQINFPRVSPDGRQVAFIGGLMSDFGSVGGDLFLAPIGGGTAIDITPDFKGSFTSIAWRGKHIVATTLTSDKTTLVEVDPANGKITQLGGAAATYSAAGGEIALDARGKRAAAVVQDFEHAPEIAVARLGRLGLATRITALNAALPPIGRARNVEWISEGRTVQGWLLAPLDLTPGKTYPMVVNIHGGPSSAVTPVYPQADVRRGPVRQLLRDGYFIFFPNPRGSFGQGEAYTRANVRDFGGGDLRDILAGVDAVEKIAPIDDTRLAVTGHSYGGFMTMWTVTHTSRFHAAVAGAGIANWISYYGENGIDQWMMPFFGASAYDDPAIYRALSPLESIKQAKTPTLIVVGERDVECPAPQSVEFWHALKAQGVETKLLILEGEGHRIRRPDHFQQLNDTEMRWLDHYLAVDR